MENNSTLEKILLVCNRNAELFQLVGTTFDSKMAFLRRMRKKNLTILKIVKTLYYSGKFSNVMDNKSKWNVIREIRIGRKCPKTDIDVDANKFNDQFVSFKVLTSIANLYDNLFYATLKYSFSFRCVDHFDVFEFISTVKLNAIIKTNNDFRPIAIVQISTRTLPFAAKFRLGINVSRSARSSTFRKLDLNKLLSYKSLMQQPREYSRGRS